MVLYLVQLGPSRWRGRAPAPGRSPLPQAALARQVARILDRRPPPRLTSADALQDLARRRLGLVRVRPDRAGPSG